MMMYLFAPIEGADRTSIWDAKRAKLQAAEFDIPEVGESLTV